MWMRIHSTAVAHMIGLGSCWINREREMFETEEGKALMKAFGLPGGDRRRRARAWLRRTFAVSRKPRKANTYRIVR